MTTAGDFLVERARAADRVALLDLLYRAFHHKNGQHPRFEFLYPEMFDPTDEAMGRHWIVRENGVPVSCAGLYPVVFQMGPARIRTLGLGQVATDPERQGRGMMHAIMLRIRADVNASETALAWLGGRHDRYSRYGWDWAGSSMRITLDAKSVGRAPEGWVVRDWNGEADVFQELWARRETQAVRGVCAPDEWRRRLARFGSRTVLARSGGRFAFAVFTPQWKSVQEWGGDGGGLRALFAGFTAEGAVSLQVLPDWEPHMPLLRSIAASAGGGLNMLSVTHLRVLAEDYAPLISERLPAGGRLRLSLREEGGVISSVMIGGRSGSTELHVELDRLRMTAFLFGPERPSMVAGLAGEDRWVDRVFPLPFVYTPLFSA